ncbi:MAG: energy transducer TonB [Nitrospirota bacterium]
MRRLLGFIPLIGVMVLLWPACSGAAQGDEATHQSDHAADAPDVILPDVHVHGVPLNRDRQLGPVATYTPWPAVPSSLDGQPLDDWMKARMLVSKNAQVTVVVLEPAKHRELTIAGLQALNQWQFEPQLKGDEPVDGELTVRIHFRTR